MAKSKTDKGDNAPAEMLEFLLSKPKNREKLKRQYQKMFDDDPVGVIERLQKLAPKPGRAPAGKGEPADKDKPRVGVDINLHVTQKTQKTKGGGAR